ncbi:TetR/AcrR family transcriptional regulator [Rhodopila sp.]|uniref:TetR/AcrR family transcriptional regulator n=1 Tax=Rhodopila sp. TaxID=2480087 RepID=UPI003D0FAD66
MRKVDPERHDEKRRQILQAAERCFVRGGFRGASTSDICAEAGISPGHLYHYFESKEAIIAAMTEIGLQKAAARFDGLMQKPDVVAALLAEIDSLRLKQGMAGSMLHLEVLAEASRNPAIAKILQHRSRRLQQLLASFLRKGQELGQVDPGLEPDAAAAIVLNVVLGAGSLRVSNPHLDGASSRAMLKLLISRFLTPLGMAET